MASNSFGDIFRFTTWGESHGPAIGVVVDGCPAGLTLSEDIIQTELNKRSPGLSAYTSPRKEPDLATILSGVFEGVTTGAPISILIKNKDADSSKYESTKNILRPGHANFTYLKKYGQFDYRGGGRASARETAARVAAGAIAKALLSKFDITVHAFISAIGDIKVEKKFPINDIIKHCQHDPLRCPDRLISQHMQKIILEAKESGDSLGGIVQLQSSALPIGLGDPVYDKLEAKLAYAMLSIPASKGFEIGEGFRAAQMQGSAHNDTFRIENNKASLTSNHAGGTLGGISSGEPILCRVAFKPTSSIAKAQNSVDINGNNSTLQLPKGSRHDPCVAVRAVAVVEAMAACVLADCVLKNRNSQI